MSKATSSSNGHLYGLARVSRVWGKPRATIYRHRDAAAVATVHHQRGPVGACPDTELVELIRSQILASRFHGEGYRKIWARLRHTGVRTAERRVRRLMGANGLLAPHRVGRCKAKAHDGTIITDTVNTMWGTDMTETVTVNEGVARVFIAIEHCNSELVGTHVSKSANRFEALEPIRQGVLHHFGPIGAAVAAGLKLRHDHGSNYMSNDFQAEIKFLGIESSPSFVREPEGNGVAERFMRTLKENLLWVQTFDTIEELRAALQEFARRYNETWLLARHRYQTPAQVRERQLQAGKAPEMNLPLAA